MRWSSWEGGCEGWIYYCYVVLAFISDKCSVKKDNLGLELNNPLSDVSRGPHADVGRTLFIVHNLSIQSYVSINDFVYIFFPVHLTKQGKALMAELCAQKGNRIIFVRVGSH